MFVSIQKIAVSRLNLALIEFNRRLGLLGGVAGSWPPRPASAASTSCSTQDSKHRNPQHKYLKNQSIGSSECIQSGKKSQLVKNSGNLLGILTWATLMTIVAINTTVNGVMTLKNITFPANDKPSTMPGTIKNMFVK